MGIYVACQCGQAFRAAAEIAPLSVTTTAPAVASAFRSGTRQSSGSKFTVGRGAFAAASVLSAVAALAAWLVWGVPGFSRDAAAQPAAEANDVATPPVAAPSPEARAPRRERRDEPRPGNPLAAPAAQNGAAGQTHRSDDGAVEFWLPARAKSETRRSFGTSAGLADRTRITWGDRKTGQLVGTVYLYRGRHDDLAADTQMKVETLKGLYKTYGARVSQSYRAITHGEFTGMQAVIQVPGERDNTFRFLDMGDYLVTLEAVGPPGFASSAPAQKFFTSLRLAAGK